MTARKKTVKTPAKMGRPSVYSEELADKIVSLIQEGYSERKISQMEGMPNASTMWRWKEEHKDFCNRSVQARKMSAEKFNEQRMEEAEWLRNIVHDAMLGGGDIPKGVVEGTKAVMQELAREAAMRDDSRFSDRKKVQMTGANDGPIEVKQDIDLTGVTTENLKAVRELLYGAKTSDTD